MHTISLYSCCIHVASLSVNWLTVGKVHWWYWIFVTAATLITLASLILWIYLAVYVSSNGELSHFCARHDHTMYNAHEFTALSL